MTTMTEVQQATYPAPLSSDTKVLLLRGMLDLLMACIDYETGRCTPDISIGTLVKPEYLDHMRHTLEITE